MSKYQHSNSKFHKNFKKLLQYIYNMIIFPLTELSYSINYTTSINVWEYSFAPREYLNQHLETRYVLCFFREINFTNFLVVFSVKSSSPRIFPQICTCLGRNGYVFTGNIRNCQTIGTFNFRSSLYECATVCRKLHSRGYDQNFQ